MSAFSRLVSDAFAGRNGKVCGSKVYRVTTTEGHKFKTGPSIDPITTAAELADNIASLAAVKVTVPKDGASVSVGGGYAVAEDSAPFSGADLAEAIRADYYAEVAARNAPPAGGAHVTAPTVTLTEAPAAADDNRHIGAALAADHLQRKTNGKAKGPKVSV